MYVPAVHIHPYMHTLLFTRASPRARLNEPTMRELLVHARTHARTHANTQTHTLAMEPVCVCYDDDDNADDICVCVNLTPVNSNPKP